MIDTEKTRKLVVDYVRVHPGTSFVELERLFDANGIEWRGPYALCWPGQPIIVMWNGWSKGAADLFSGMYSGNILDLRYGPTLLACYTAEGSVVDLPLATDIRAYSEDRWMPTLLELGDNA